jgi:hypothetical protein
MATKDEWVEPEEFDKIADETLVEKGGDLKKVNANMIATRMGRKKANATFYRLFDDWKQRRRVQAHLPPFVVQDKHRELLENVLIVVGTEVSAEATHVAGFRTRDLQDENDSLRGDRNDLLTMVDERDVALEAASRQIDQLKTEVAEARADAADQTRKAEALTGRLIALQDARASLDDPDTIRQLAGLIANAVAENTARQPEASVRDNPGGGQTTSASDPAAHPDLLDFHAASLGIGSTSRTLDGVNQG